MRVPSFPSPAGTVRVQPVPGAHDYVQGVAGALPGVTLLPDPPPRVRGARPGQWWPPAVLDPSWWSRPDRSGTTDVLHVHFGFEQVPTERLEAALRAARSRGVAVVWTAHDLDNPHLHDQTAHHHAVSLLVEHSDAVLTLTAGAAERLRRDWGRGATVLPHPSVVPADVRRRLGACGHPGARRRGGPPVVGVSLKPRANVAGDLVLPALVDWVSAHPDARLRVDVHPDLASSPGLRPVLEAAAARPRVQVERVGHLPDRALWRRVADLDVAVLPYRHGTHSGWYEMCRDLGVGVVVPTSGEVTGQGEHHPYDLDHRGLDAASLHAALDRAVARPHPAPSTAWRAARDRRVRAAHAELYRSLAGPRSLEEGA